MYGQAAILAAILVGFILIGGTLSLAAYTAVEASH